MRYYLDNVFGAVVSLVVIVGVMLIYALMLNDIDSKTYEYGMLRALGLRNISLIQVLVTKSIFFAFPGEGLYSDLDSCLLTASLFGYFFSLTTVYGFIFLVYSLILI